jgi:protein-S-isoprenylcysteine O-methyltransferase Ste14
MPSLIDLTGYFIFLCFIVFILVWIVTAFSTKRTMRSSGTWRGSFLVIAVGAVLLARLTRGSASSWTGAFWEQTLPLALVGDALTFVGLVVMLWARFTLGRNWSAGVVLKQDQELIMRGPYRYVRHPIYSGGLLMMLGWAVWTGRAASFFALVVGLVIVWFKAGAEEKLMTEHFGNGYRDYKARVKALVPYVL